MRYINVFRDSTGEIHYSDEEFLRFQQELPDFESAISDAYRHSVIGMWQYIGTLRHDEGITRKMQERLVSLEKAKALVEAHGKVAADYDADEIENEAFSL